MLSRPTTGKLLLLGLFSIFILHFTLLSPIQESLVLIFGWLLTLIFLYQPKWGLLLIIILRPSIDKFSENITLNLNENLHFNAAALLGALVVVLLSVYIGKNHCYLKQLPLKKLWFVFVLICILSLFFSIDFTASVYELVRLISVIGIFFSFYILSRKEKVPMVMTLHDYKLICPNYKLYTQGKLCEKCKGGKYYHCLIGRCLKNSFSYSLLAMLEAYIHRFRGTYRKVDLFLSPSKFLLEKCLEFGIPADKVQLLRYPFDIQSYDQYRNKDSYQEQNYYLYYGRLSEEKGIKDLILATKRLADAGKLKNNKLLIVGKGPQEEELKQLAKKVQLSSVIEFAGFQQGKNLTDIIQKAKFIVVPSVWYDNSPLVVIESQLLGKPVLVSDRGGTQESIIKNRTGFVFSAGKIGDLARKMEKLIVLAKEERQEMGRLGRENMQKINNEQLLYEKMMEIYAQVIEKRRSL